MSYPNGPDNAGDTAQTDETLLADYALGYAEPPEGDSAGDTGPDKNPDTGEGTQDAGGGEPADVEGVTADRGQDADGDTTADNGGDNAADNWEQEKHQYEQALQYMATMIHQMQQGMPSGVPQAPAGAPASVVPGQGGVMYPPAVFGAPGGVSGAPTMGQGVPPTVQQTFGYPAGQFPAMGQQPTTPTQAQTAAQPAATPEPEIDDEELQEQFWNDPVKASRTLTQQVVRQTIQEQLLPLIQQREAYFGQVLGQQILGPLAQRVQMFESEMQWRDRVSQEVQQLRKEHSDFDEVAPVIRKMIEEQPQLLAKMRENPEKHGMASLYKQAKERMKKEPSLRPVPGGKGAARMPRAGAARVVQVDDNDALVEAALGPMTKGVFD